MSPLFTHPVLVLALYCALVFVASLAGGWILMAFRLTHARLQMLVSFVAGLMLGVALLHMIPHAQFQLHSLDLTMGWVLGGFLAMFFIQRFFHFHHHDLPDKDPEDCCHGTEGHLEEDAMPHVHTLAAKSASQLSWAGTVIGLSLHALLDGVALAAAVAAESHGHGLIALGTALVILLHKPFDSIAISAMMARTGHSTRSRHVFNVLFALVAPLGVILFCAGAGWLAGEASPLIGSALAFSGGMFLCISCSDLLPELQFHSHDRLRLSLALAAGLAVSVLIGQFETTGHDSFPKPSPTMVH
jgi:zinc and cadmium transporter